MISAQRKKLLQQHAEEATELLIDKYLKPSIEKTYVADDEEHSYAVGYIGRLLLQEGLYWLALSLGINTDDDTHEQMAETLFLLGKIEQSCLSRLQKMLNAKRKRHGLPPLRFEE